MTQQTDNLTPRWYTATVPGVDKDPVLAALLTRECKLLMPPAMVDQLTALGWRVVEIVEAGQHGDD